MGFVEIEAAGKRMLEQFPWVKRAAKRVYQGLSVIASQEKFRAEGELVKVSPNDDYEFFYGYYDKSPWDATDRYMICLRVRQTHQSVAPKEAGTVCLIDTMNHDSVIEIGTTHSWNVQQGCMAQWMGPDFKSRIIYNDFRDGRYCSVIYHVPKMAEEKVLPLPVYDVSRDGTCALSLDFSRLHRMRPGYGYSNLPDRTKGVLCPEECCIWKMDIPSGKVTELLKYTDFAAFEPDETMKDAEHKVNHLMISPNGKRFMALHRWFQKGRKHTRLVTVNTDGTEMYNLSDDVFVSHCFWKNDREILSFLRKKEMGDHYYLMTDKTQDYRLYWPELNTDGHCSYSPDGKFVVTDTYPNRKRIASVYLCTEEDNHSRRIARVFSPFRYDNECRCDLHPRWNRAGDKICIDSVHEGKRGLYVIPLQSNPNDPSVSESHDGREVADDDTDAVIAKLSGYQYVSFDIFDTLLRRDVAKPGDVFDFMESVIPKYCHFSIPNFSMKRVAAERLARDKSDTEITLDDIYHSFRNETVLANQERLKQLEQDIELAVSCPDARAKKIYQWCIENQKNIYLISDMYLPKAFIEKLLAKGGYTNYKGLYISSACKYRKAQSGALYTFVCQKEGIRPEQLIHMGDSERSDVENAKRAGCSAVLWKPERKTEWFSKRGKLPVGDAKQLDMLKAFCSNRTEHLRDPFLSLGYEGLGPLLFGFSQWMHAQLVQKGIQRVFFFSRDGLIMKRAFDTLYPGDEIKTEYLLVSRRSLRVPQLWMDMSYEKVIDSLPAASVQSLRQFFDSVGLNYTDYKEVYAAQGMQEDYVFSVKNALSNDKLRAVYRAIESDLYQNSLKEYHALSAYLEKLNFRGKVAVVDIGWRGSMQSFLYKLGKQLGLDVSMEGFYIGLAAGARAYRQKMPLNFSGYLFDCVANQADSDLRNPFVGVMETLFLSQSGSVMNYSLDEEDGVSVALYPNEYEAVPGQLTADAQKVKTLQEGAMMFVRDAMGSVLAYSNFSARAAFHNIYRLGMRPTGSEARLFGNMEFSDGQAICLAKPRPMHFYMLYPKALPADFYKSRWKIGFMKRLLKLPLPYGKMYEALKKIQN